MPSQIPSALGPVERAQAGSLCAAIYTLRAASPRLSSEELVVLLTIALHPGMPQVKVAGATPYLTNGTKMRIFNNLSEQGEGGKSRAEPHQGAISIRPIAGRSYGNSPMQALCSFGLRFGRPSKAKENMMAVRQRGDTWCVDFMVSRKRIREYGFTSEASAQIWEI